MGALCSHRGGCKPYLFKSTRRNLFELHAGQQTRQLPSNILLEEFKPAGPPELETQFTTSEDLIAALGPIGLEYAPEEAKEKVNLSYVRDPMLLCLNRGEAIKEAREAEEKAKIAREKGNYPVKLKGLFVQYLREVDPILKYKARFRKVNSTDKTLDDALLKFLSKDNIRLLDDKGYDITDLMNWAWVLTSETTERATTRLLAITALGFTKIRDEMMIPQFVYVFLLRRRNSSPNSLRSLLIYAWKLMEKLESVVEPSPQLGNIAKEALQHESPAPIRRVQDPRSDHPLGMKEKAFMIMVIRLLRSARKVWPAACDSIVSLINRYLNGINFRRGASPPTILTSEGTAQLSYMYNTLLKLVSIPASVRPFESAFHQQRAQFSLLRRMNDFEPPLIVDRRGYRAVVSMQLRHRKTLKEREWATMKAKSWPPWKEEKLGIDAQINPEHGISRAMEAIRRSWEAGYAPDNWGAVASILSGWDTDHSPTIQTRVLHPSFEHRTEDARIWESRIRATRTLDEAWSCFLSYKDQNLRPVGASYVYHQMFEKIVHDAKRPAAEDADPTLSNHLYEQQPLPGDGTEVFAAPQSPREAIYVRRPPPTMDEFVDMMAKDSIKPGKRFLSSMLRNAPTVEAGLQYLETSTMPNAQKCVLRDEKLSNNPEAQAALESISPSMFSSFIRMLTRFSPKTPDEHEPNKIALVHIGSVGDCVTKQAESAQLHLWQSCSSSKRSSSRPDMKNPLLHAIQLVLARKVRFQPAWYHLLQALSEPKVVTDVVARFVDRDYEDIRTWQMTCHLLDEMLKIDLTLDLDGFHILCVGLEKAIFAGERLSRKQYIRRGSNNTRDDTKSFVDHVLSTGLPLLKEMFKNLVRSKSMQQEMPVSLLERNSEIDDSVERQGASESDELEESIVDEATTESRAFLHPGCLLPRLLEVPHPACLHAFVRVLGLRRDYNGLLDLVEWMCLFADEINAVIDERANGYGMMRRCLTAIHVFMERSWIVLERKKAEARGEDPSTVHNELEMKAEPASEGIVKAIREIVSENKTWGGWPDEDEVVQYCENGKFI